MKIKRVIAAFFSPTNGTKKYVQGIAGRLMADFEIIDLARPENRRTSAFCGRQYF